MHLFSTLIIFYLLAFLLFLLLLVWVNVMRNANMTSAIFLTVRVAITLFAVLLKHVRIFLVNWRVIWLVRWLASAFWFNPCSFSIWLLLRCLKLLLGHLISTVLPRTMNYYKLLRLVCGCLILLLHDHVKNLAWVHLEFFRSILHELHQVSSLSILSIILNLIFNIIFLFFMLGLNFRIELLLNLSTQLFLLLAFFLFLNYLRNHVLEL